MTFTQTKKRDKSTLKETMGSIPQDKPHAVLVPFPAQGHITPMLQVGKLLHSKGFHITFVNTEYNHKRFIRSRGKDSVKGIDGFNFETIPDGLPSLDVDVTQDIPSLCDSTSKHCLAPFRDLVAKLNSEALPKVSCIVSDSCMSFTLDVAEELGIPNVLFWTASACGFMVYLHYRVLIEKGLVPLNDISDLTNGYLDTQVDCIPGMSKIRLKDCPSFFRTVDSEDLVIRFLLRETSRVLKGSAIILNTFDELEHDVLLEMGKLLPPVYSVGPLHLLANQLPTDNPLTSLSSSLWKEDLTCVDWLETKEPGSVVYVNYGSITVMTNEQMVEFAWGLAKSNIDFLWIIRRDILKGENAILPKEFLVETKGRSLIADWCNQEKILSHPSIGGFLTHNGWNSTLESICSGVPMICWPFFAEQQTNCRYVCAEWGVGMEIDTDVKRDEVEVLIKELMLGEKGKEMRERESKLNEKALRATQHGGSSIMNLQRMIEEVMLKI